MKKREDPIVGFIGLGLMGGARWPWDFREAEPREIWGYDLKRRWVSTPGPRA